jgi:Zn-dependent M16 (insulinase) family peptidase
VLDPELKTLPSRLAALRDKVIRGATPTVAMIGADASCSLGRDWLAGNAEKFGRGGGRQKLPAVSSSAARIGLAAPADVAFAARTLPAPAMSDADAPALVLLGIQLSYGYLWNEVRVKGGAYGVRAGFDGSRGSFNFSSFRDPNIGRTLSAFSGAMEFVEKEMDLSPAGVEQAIIGAIKTLDVPMRPPSAVVSAMGRHLGGDDEAFRKDFRRRLLSLTADQVRSAAARIFAGMDSAPVCVLSSRERLTEENRTAEKPFVIESLWE